MCSWQGKVRCSTVTVHHNRGGLGEARRNERRNGKRLGAGKDLCPPLFLFFCGTLLYPFLFIASPPLPSRLKIYYHDINRLSTT